MKPASLTQLVRRLEGGRVSVALIDGSRLDDCQLISAGHGRVRSLWLYHNGSDVFVPLADLVDLWEVFPRQHSRVA